MCYTKRRTHRRKVFYKEKRAELGKKLRVLCERKKIKIVEAGVCPNHAHMLADIPLKVSVLSFMGYLKGKNSLMISDSLLLEVTPLDFLKLKPLTS